jgi:hypothetical protein
MRYILAALVVGLFLGSAAFAADPPKAAPTYHLERQCHGRSCQMVWVQDATPIPTSPTATACPCPTGTCTAGGACTSGQCGMTGCNAVQGETYTSAAYSSSGDRWHLGDRIRERRASRRGGSGSCSSCGG